MSFVTRLGFILPITHHLLIRIARPNPKGNAKLDLRSDLSQFPTPPVVFFKFLDGKVDVGCLKTNFVVVSMYQNIFFTQDIVHVNL